MNSNRLRPRQGHVLVELLPYETKTSGGLHLPDGLKRKDMIGRMPLQRARVHSCGVWATTKNGIPIPYEFRRGDLVLVDPVFGTNVDVHPLKMKIYHSREIAALILKL